MAALIVAALQPVLSESPAGSVTFDVTNADDAGPGSLRQAFADAASSPGDDSIAVQPAVGEIFLSNGDLVYNPGDGAALTLQGNGVAIRQATADVRVITSPTNASLTIIDATISDANATEATGGGIYSEGPLVLQNVAVSGNNASSTTASPASQAVAGGIWSGSTVTLIDSQVNDNSATSSSDGVEAVGGIYAAVGVELNSSEVSSNGANSTGSVGPAVGAIDSHDVSLVDSDVSANSAMSATDFASGGVRSTNDLAVTRSAIIANGAGAASWSSGALYAEGEVELTDSTVDSNSATSDTGDASGGVFAGLENVRVSGSTISSNSGDSTNQGATGGLRTAGALALTNVTVVANSGSGASASGSAGGLRAMEITLTYVTLSDNSGSTGGNVLVVEASEPGVLTSFGSVVVSSGADPNCGYFGQSSTTSEGYNFSDDTSGATSCMFNAATDQTSAGNDPQLGLLTDNGGPTQTRLPASGSPLIDAIPMAACDAAVATDQRGVPRPQGPGCEIGAVEAEVPGPLVHAALGDSFSSGEGNPEFDPGTNVGAPSENRCHRSTAAYGRRLTPAMITTLVACSGAEIENLLAGGSERGAWGEPPQVSVLDSETDLVTFMVGGNDVGFAPILTYCVLNFDCVDKMEQLAPSGDDVVDFNIRAIYSDLLALDAQVAGADNRPTFVVGYPQIIPLPDEGDALCELAFSDEERLWLRLRTSQLNAVIRTAAQVSGIHYVDLSTAFSGHEVCTSEPWVNWVDPLNIEYSFHPNRAGQAVLAAAVDAELASLPNPAPQVVTEPIDPGDPVQLDPLLTFGGALSDNLRRPGHELVVRIGGFAINALVELVFHSDPVSLGTFQADASGFVQATVTIPSDASIGLHAVTAEGAAPDGTTKFAVGGITVANPPSAPTGVAATPSNGQAIVTWLVPADDGGLPVDGYVVTASPGGQSCLWTGGPLECSVSGLVNGTPYTFTAVATNGVGESVASDASTPVTPRTTPGAPTGVSVIPGDSQARVWFTPPADDGGSLITTYTVTASPGGQTAAGANSPVTVTGLANGTAYTFTVTATNAAGTGPPSAPSAPGTPAAPGTPRSCSASASRSAGGRSLAMGYAVPVGGSFGVGLLTVPALSSRTARRSARRRLSRRGVVVVLVVVAAAVLTACVGGPPPVPQPPPGC